MPTPFPGMDPYLEQSGIWEEVHTQLIVDMARALNRQVSPRYRVAIEQRSYMSLVWSDQLVGLPDVMVVDGGGSRLPTAVASTGATPIVAELPLPQEIIERYLEIRMVDEQQRVITAIEVLSPTNKYSHEGRELYLAKRLKVLSSMTNLVEIDLLRAGQPMPMKVPNEHKSNYRILVSRAYERPRSALYAFSVREPIPVIPVPLQRDESEPVLDLNALLHDLYDSLSYDHTIHYRRAADPPLTGEDATWADALLREHGLRP